MVVVGLVTVAVGLHVGLVVAVVVAVVVASSVVGCHRLYYNKIRVCHLKTHRQEDKLNIGKTGFKRSNSGGFIITWRFAEPTCG